MAPEALKKQQYSRKSDVYSFGVVIYEIVTCSNPWPDHNPMQAAHEVMMGNTMTIPECQEIFKQMMKLCWQYDPKDRPEFTDLLNMIKSTEEPIAEEKEIENSLDKSSIIEYQLKNSEYDMSSSVFNTDYHL